MKKILPIIVLGFLSGIAGSYFHTKWNQTNWESDASIFTVDHISEIQNTANLPGSGNYNSSVPLMDEDFVVASARSTKSVVYIKNISSRSYGYSFYDWFFGERAGNIETVSSGSGVILSEDGYIVTNNHVVKGADKIEVVHNRRTFEAKLIGTDPSSDLAVLKIEGNNLIPIKIGSSREVQVGEWVVAVGNPFNLTSTVTAGIVSAKGRELKILESKFPIESFIQTDAAINPGNSGGALVNKEGELIGINTAIISKTGSYAGYGFAVPSDVVKKIVKDLIEYGEVQKAFLGTNVSDLNSEIAERLDLDVDENNLEGVVIDLIVQGGAADNVGLKEGDIITKIDNNKIASRSDFEEVLSYYSPGESVTVSYQRKQVSNEKRITLTNREGTTEVLKREVYPSEYLGADLEAVSKVEKDILDIDHGVKIVKVYDRGLMSSLGLDEGFIVTNINNTSIDEPKKLAAVLREYRGRVKIEGVDASGRKGYYTFYLR
jgi:Do/DeqQ family serine protease